MNTKPTRTPACRRAREWIHRILDGDLADADLRAELDRHLKLCAACRESLDEMRWIQQGLRALPSTPFPEDALERVWDRTVRSRKIVTFPKRGFDWRLAAAAAVIFVAAFLGVRTWNLPSPAPEPGPAELARAAREMRLVLNLTADALRKTGSVAMKNVLAEEVSPALRRVPVRWPAGPPEGRRRGES